MAKSYLDRRTNGPGVAIYCFSKNPRTPRCCHRTRLACFRRIPFVSHGARQEDGWFQSMAFSLGVFFLWVFDALTWFLSSAQKKNAESINSRLALVMKSGKYTLGYKTVLKSLRGSKGVLFFLLQCSSVCIVHTKNLWVKFVYFARMGMVLLHLTIGLTLFQGVSFWVWILYCLFSCIEKFGPEWVRLCVS